MTTEKRYYKLDEESRNNLIGNLVSNGFQTTAEIVKNLPLAPSCQDCKRIESLKVEIEQELQNLPRFKNDYCDGCSWAWRWVLSLIDKMQKEVK